MRVPSVAVIAMASSPSRGRRGQSAVGRHRAGSRRRPPASGGAWRRVPWRCARRAPAALVSAASRSRAVSTCSASASRSRWKAATMAACGTNPSYRASSSPAPRAASRMGPAAVRASWASRATGSRPVGGRGGRDRVRRRRGPAPPSRHRSQFRTRSRVSASASASASTRRAPRRPLARPADPAAATTRPPPPPASSCGSTDPPWRRPGRWARPGTTGPSATERRRQGPPRVVVGAHTPHVRDGRTAPGGPPAGRGAAPAGRPSGAPVRRPRRRAGASRPAPRRAARPRRRHTRPGRHGGHRTPVGIGEKRRRLGHGKPDGGEPRGLLAARHLLASAHSTSRNSPTSREGATCRDARVAAYTATRARSTPRARAVRAVRPPAGRCGRARRARPRRARRRTSRSSGGRAPSPAPGMHAPCAIAAARFYDGSPASAAWSPTAGPGLPVGVAASVCGVARHGPRLPLVRKRPYGGVPERSTSRRSVRAGDHVEDRRQYGRRGL